MTSLLQNVADEAALAAHSDNAGHYPWPYDKGRHQTECALCDALDALGASQ